ncbi:DUF2243 domain-containing protein [Phenylobacterium sp.]|jgi:uncharacterized membrane protein|uniref:DUF2243 domain-containing protein n=1 Tax=Phenylobacterium sp. TaxID=1871053 RepID=UPI002F922417
MRSKTALQERDPPRLSAAGLVLGVSLGGFFDGILLHQILQWHHLLSAIRPQDARFQVAADGYFHALMYLVAGAGLWMLWRAQRRSAGSSGRSLAASLLAGFGAWNVADIVLFHWLAGIHRVRLDVPDPLFWDLGWLAVFALAPLAAAWALARSGGAPPRAGGAMAASIAALLTVGAGAASLRPADGDTTAVLFRPGTSQAAVMNALVGQGARLVWMDASGELVIVQLDEPARAPAFYRDGAILVTGAGGAGGCLSYLKT